MSDLVVVGAGPAGLAAAVSAASDGLSVTVLESAADVGGQASTSSRIENYLGFARGLTGAHLARSAREQAEKFGATLITSAPVIDLRSEGDSLRLVCADGSPFMATTVLIAAGVQYRRLTVPGIDPLIGRGVFYGASPANAGAYRGKHVAIVGGANSAGQAAVHLAVNGARVSILARSPLEKSMSAYLIDRIRRHRNIEVREGARVAACHGANRLHSVTIADENSIGAVPCVALFVFIGAEPHTEWATALDKDGHGFIVADGSFGTSVPGVFVAGDVRSGSVKRVATAAGEGAMAVQSIHSYMKEGV